MHLHAYFLAALVAISILFARPEAEASCGVWDAKIGSVTTPWTAAQICDGGEWKRGTPLLYSLALGSSVGLYPWEIIKDPSCIAFIQVLVEEAEDGFRHNPKGCANLNTWFGDPLLRKHLLAIGLVD